MQDMLVLANSKKAKAKNTIFYFDQDMIYIIFEVTTNPFEVDLSIPIAEQWFNHRKSAAVPPSFWWILAESEMEF